MKALHTKPGNHVAVLAKKLRKLERCGRYEDALSAVADIWDDIDSQPKVDQFDHRDAAEILLRCGSLYGFYGHNKQIRDAQIMSKDLLTKAREGFAALAEPEKVAECENHLALAYWRTGEFREAEAWIAEALSHDLPGSSDSRIYAYLTKTLINLSCKRFEENIALASSLEQDFQQLGDAFLLGSFFSNIALSYKNLGQTTEAHGYLELAKYYHQRSRHKIYLGIVENNLAQLHKAEGRFERAHDAIDSANRIFKRLEDKTREGFSLDTKAQIYLAEGRYAQALQAVRKAILLLQETENSSYLAETYLTKAKTLLFVNDFPAAILALVDGVVLARNQAGDDAARELVLEFETALKEKNEPIPSASLVERSDFELVLPPSISHYADYQGIWVNNSYLDKIGVKKGSLAIVVQDKIIRGDLVAISEIETLQVSCGFYDADFGIVCLERVDCEPRLFDEKDIKILGKIVGVCNSGKRADGKMIVEALNL